MAASGGGEKFFRLDSVSSKRTAWAFDGVGFFIAGGAGAVSHPGVHLVNNTILNIISGGVR